MYDYDYRRTTETISGIYGSSRREYNRITIFRRYFRLTGAKTLIGVCGTSVEENDAFLYMAAHFRKSGLPVPKVHIVSENKSYYLQEDLGDTLLFHAIEKGRATSVFSEEEKELLRKTVRLPEPTASTFPVVIRSRSSISVLSFGI